MTCTINLDVLRRLMTQRTEINATLSPAAEKFIRRMMRFANGPEAGFRLKVARGGCSGLAAEFDLQAAPGAGEAVWETAGMRIFLGAESRLLLNGATIDFVETLSHTGFVFTTPGASGSACSSEPKLVSIEMPARR
jgi:iron-sulfur cluster assembly protein